MMKSHDSDDKQVFSAPPPPTRHPVPVPVPPNPTNRPITRPPQFQPGMNLFTCKRHTVSGGERRPLRLLVTLLLLELPELGLDGHRRLLGLGVLHVDVKVLGDVRLGGVCEETEKYFLRELGIYFVVSFQKVAVEETN